MAEVEPKSHTPPADLPPAKMTELDEPEKHHHHHHHLGKEGASPAGYGYGRYRVRDRHGALSATLVTLLILAGIAALTVWLVYRPHKPKFRVVGVNVYQLNTTSPPFISTTIQFTVVTRNPNKRVSIYYDNLSAYVSYKDQPITAPLTLPPLFHETKSTVALSPVLGGSPVPVVAEAAKGLQMEQSYGVVGLKLVLTGRLRYKVGAIWSRRNGVYVRCNLYVGSNNGTLPLLASPPCTVET